MIPHWEHFNEDEFEKGLNREGIFSPRQKERLRGFYYKVEPSLTLPWEEFKDWITLILSMTQPLDGKEFAAFLREELFIWLLPYLQRSLSNLLAEGVIEGSADNIFSVAPKPAQPLTPSERFDIMKRDDYRCRLCGAAARDGEHVRLEVDHRMPRSRRGTNDQSNLWTLCFSCNRGKGRKEL